VYRWGPHPWRGVAADGSVVWVRVPWPGWGDPGVVVGTVWVVVMFSAFSVVTGWMSGSGSTAVVFGAPIVVLLWIQTTVLGVLVGAVINAGRWRHVDAAAPTHVRREELQEGVSGSEEQALVR